MGRNFDEHREVDHADFDDSYRFDDAATRPGLGSVEGQRGSRRTAIIAAIHRWNRLHGNPPSAHNWRRASLISSGRFDLLNLLDEGDWPTTGAVCHAFGTWAAAIEAAGFPKPTRGTDYGQRVKQPALERFEALYVADTETGCWNWIGTKFRGYGAFTDETGRRWPAHRWAYEHIVAPVPAELVIDHLCRNKACVNPAHLESVTVRVNTLRGTGPTAVNAQKTHCKRGHLLEGDNLLITGGKRWCRECRRLHSRWRRDERRARADLYPATGDVAAAPVRRPSSLDLDDLGGDAA